MFELLSGSYSQSGQESLVLNLLKFPKRGFYVEIGAYHSTDLSNTFLLETDFNWNGLAFEIDRKKSKEYNQNRSNKCVTADATKFDYHKCFAENAVPKVIDYLQVDIEPAFQSLAALKMLPFDEYKFRVITFEHDLYADEENAKVQDESFELLQGLGYRRIAKNVRSNGFPYEDWYLHPGFVEDDMSVILLSSDCEWRAHFK